MSLEVIEQYTVVEGGGWLDWPSNVDNTIPKAKELADVLKEKPKHRGSVEFEKRALGAMTVFMTLHSFRTTKDRRWDCLNGWTTEAPLANMTYRRRRQTTTHFGR
jgi:hypothetical protein